MIRWLMVATFLLTWLGCRDVSVCEGGGACILEGGAGDSNAGAPGAIGLGGESTMTTGGADPGSAGEAAEPSAAGSSSTDGECPPLLADCDGSTLTTCETPTNYSFLHCGGCDRRCDGDCVLGTCKPGEEVTRRAVHRVVTTGLVAYALVYGESADDPDDVWRVDLQTGENEVIAKGVPSFGELFLGRDRLYVWHGIDVASLTLDGSGQRTEDFEAESFGATSEGVYYTTSETDPVTEQDRWTLWFRPHSATTSSELLVGSRMEIRSSAATGLLLQRDLADASELFFLQGSELSTLGLAPAVIESALVVQDGAFVLASDGEDPPHRELLRLRARDRIPPLAVGTPDPEARLVAAPGGVALLFKGDMFRYVRLFTKDGDAGVSLGLPTYTDLVHVDASYVWYSWYAAQDGAPRFFRARQFESSDLRAK